jgi:MFS family permease
VRGLRAPDALRDANVARYVVAAAVSSLGSGMAQVALAFAVLDLGGPTDLGLVLVAREIPLVVLVLLGGVWADRVSRRAIMVGADAVRSSAQAVTALLLFTGTADVWSLALLQMAFGGVEAFSRPAYTGLVQQLVRPEALQQANALLGLARSTTRIAGPALGAVLVAAASPAWALAVDAATFAVSGLLVLSLRIARTARTAAGSVLGDLRDGWREFTSRTWVWTIVVYFGLFQLSLFPALLVLGPFVAKEELGGAGAWGTILACQGVGAVLGGLLALRVSFARPLVASTLLCTPTPVLLLLFAAPAPVIVLAAVGCVSAIGLTLGDTVWFSTFQRHIPEHAVSRISSFDWFGSVALNPIGYVLVGPLSEAIGVSTTLLVAGVVNLALAPLLLTVSSVRRLPAYPAPSSSH